MRAAASSFVDSDASRLRHEFASTPALILTVWLIRCSGEKYRRSEPMLT